MDASKPVILENEPEGTVWIQYNESNFLRKIQIKYDQDHDTEGKDFKITADNKDYSVVVYGPGVYDEKITSVVLNKGSECDKAQSSFISIGKPKVFPLKLKVNNASEWNVNIVTPIGDKLPGFIKTLPNGQLGLRFTPRDIGNHIVNMKHPSNIIKNPIILVVKENDLLKASKIKIMGNFLDRCHANTENVCTIDTTEAGNESLSILVEGIGKCLMNYADQDDGTYLLKYTFSTPGDYTLNLRFGDEHIPGSPFMMKVEPKDYSSDLQGSSFMMKAERKEDTSQLPGSSFMMKAEPKEDTSQLPGSSFMMKAEPKEDTSQLPECSKGDSPPPKKRRLDIEQDLKKDRLSNSRIISLERENAFLRFENANLARLLNLSENTANPGTCKNESSIAFILDTNVLIHKLALVNKLKDSVIEGCPVTICIPYIVIQELDHMKFKHKNHNETRIAIHYVNEILEKHPSYYAQSINEAKIAETVFGITGDDKVLECCLGLSKKYKNVFLLTKDVNLVNVARFWRVRTYDLKRLESFLKPGKNFGFKEIKEERKKLFGQTSEEIDNSDDESSNPLDSSLTTSDDYSSE